MRSNLLKKTMLLSVLALLSVSTIAFGEDATEDELLLDDMIVTATKTEHKLSDIPESAAIITKEDIESANVDSAADAIGWISGTRLKKASFAPNNTTVGLLGLPSSYSLVLVNGQRVYGGGTERGTSQSVDLSQFPADMIERIEIVKGPASTLYGSEAVAGVINIITKKPIEKTQLFLATETKTYNTQTHKARIGSSFGFFSYLIHYTKRSSDGREYEDQHDLQKFESDNISANLNFKISPAINLSVMPAYFAQKEEYANKNRYTSSVNNSLDYNMDNGDKLIFRLSSYQFDSEWDKTSRGSSAVTTVEETNQKLESEIIYNGTFFDNNSITFGYQHFNEKYTYYLIDDEITQTMNSAYVHDEIDLNSFILTIGGRMDNYDRWGDNFYPQIGLLYYFNDNLKLKASGGQAFKSPSFGNMYYHEFLMGGQYYIVGNPDLKPEKALGYQVGIDYSEGSFLLRGSIFRNEIKDMISGYTITDNHKMGKALKSYQNIDKVITQGIEVNMTAKFSALFSGKLGYTFIDSEDVATGLDLVDTPDHKLTTELVIKESGFIPKTNIRCEYVGKRFTTVSNEPYELEPYTLAHIKMTKTLFKHFKAYAAINNMLTKEIENDDMPEVEMTAGVSYTY